MLVVYLCKHNKDGSDSRHPTWGGKTSPGISYVFCVIQPILGEGTGKHGTLGLGIQLCDKSVFLMYKGSGFHLQN